MEAIKLVIWDLDETFWHGTLSEGGIQYRPEHHEMVIELSRRGIVNSICSKNDFDAAKRVLEQQGSWNYFVFPKIAWSPKGEMIARTLDEMGLRAPNALFVDDNPQNLEEAKFYSPGLQVAGPESLAELLERPSAKGKDDRQLSRLAQYQLLEKKAGDRQQFASSNEDFLRQCQIRVEIRHDCQAVFDRLLEMIGRTNQLNFTKTRLEADALRHLIGDPAFECGYVKVRDRYGDYGISGFYARTDGRLEHFLFSCRVLNMGVEQWIYDRLGRPQLTIAGEVSDDPTRLPVGDWIRPLDAEGETPPTQTTSSVSSRLRVLLKGGCDLEQVIDFLGRTGAVEGEFNYVTAHGTGAHSEHTEILRRCGSDVPGRFAEVLETLPFLDAKAYETRFLSGDHDVYVYSTLMDMTNGLYRYGDTDWIVPFGDLNVDLTDERCWPLLTSRIESLSVEFLSWFRERFTFEGALSEDGFRQNLDWLCQRIDPARQLILLNGAEIALDHEYEGERHEHHRRMNAVLAEVASGYDHVDVCDVRKFVRSPADVTNNVRHYRRGTYHRIAGEIRDLIGRRWSLENKSALGRLNEKLFVASVFGKNAIWRAVKRVRGRSTKRAQ